MNLASLPNVLTVARIVAVPLVVVLFYWQHPWSNPLAAIVFIAAAITVVVSPCATTKSG